MKLKITVCFTAENESAERRLAELRFVETTNGRYASLAVPQSDVTLPDGTFVAISARYSPPNSGTSIVVTRGGKQLALVLAPWQRCDPYLGLQIEDKGFLHLYCQQEEQEESKF